MIFFFRPFCFCSLEIFIELHCSFCLPWTKNIEKSNRRYNSIDQRSKVQNANTDLLSCTFMEIWISICSLTEVIVFKNGKIWIEMHSYFFHFRLNCAHNQSQSKHIHLQDNLKILHTQISSNIWHQNAMNHLVLNHLCFLYISMVKTGRHFYSFTSIFNATIS